MRGAVLWLNSQHVLEQFLSGVGFSRPDLRLGSCKKFLSLAGAVGRQELSNCRFRISTNELIHGATVFEKNAIWSALYPKLHGELRVLFSVDLSQDESSLIFSSQFFQ